MKDAPTDLKNYCFNGRLSKERQEIIVLSKILSDDINKSARNLTGIDIVKPDQINIEYLAPGGDAGRLTMFTKSAL